MIGPLSRRELLQQSALGALGLTVPLVFQQSATGKDMRNFSDDPLLKMSLGESARLLRSGELLARDLAEAVIAATEQHADLHAYISFDADQLRNSAVAADAALKRGDDIGSLHGVPLILKDNINTAALPTSGGTPGLKNNRPGVDAPVAARLFAGGALLAGKANLHELSAGGTSNNHTFGAVGNPYDTDRGRGRRLSRTGRPRHRHGGIGQDAGCTLRTGGPATDHRPISGDGNHSAEPDAGHRRTHRTQRRGCRTDGCRHQRGTRSHRISLTGVASPGRSV